MEAIRAAIAYLADPAYWAALLSVALLAAMASAIPGMNAFLVMALAFPFILFEIEDPAIGLVVLATISGVSNTLDSIPAILIGQPSAATQVTFLEGHQLARQGKAAHTLGAVYAVSALGGIVGAALLVIAIPVARPWVLQFGFPEITATAIIGIVMVTVLSRGAMIKGIIAALVGMLLAIVGDMGRLSVDPFVRLPLIPFIIGLFALPEMIDLMINRQPVAAAGASVSHKEVFRGARYGASRWAMTIRQSVFGVFLGAIPGVGSAVVDWLSYAFGVILTKDKSQFGKGSLDGVLFAESAQNAKEAGAALPTLALGVPGAPTWALVVTAMIPYGVAPGPQMLGQNAHITILLVITLALANLAITGIGLGTTGFLARLTRAPYPIIGSIIIPVALLSAFIDTTSWRGVQVALGVGAMGIAMKRYGWPRPPMILGFILLPIIERNFSNSVSLFGYAGTFSRPLTIIILAIALAVGAILLRSVLQMERQTRVVESPPPPPAHPSESTDASPTATPSPPPPPAHPSESTDASPTNAPSPPPPAAQPAQSLLRSLRRPEVIIPLVVFAGVALLLSDHLRNPLRPELRYTTFPFWLASAALALLLIELWRGVRGWPRPATIMDLGLLSAGAEGARDASLKLVALFALLILVGVTVGLQYGAIAFAAAGPIALLRGAGKWPLAALSAAIVYAFIFIFLNNILFVIYPTPFLSEWLAERIF